MISANLVHWLHATEGNWVRAPGGIGGECVDLANDYIIKVWGGSAVRLNAAQWRHAVMPHEWDFERNGPSNYPPTGAIVVWRGDAPVVGIGENGHVAVALLSDAMQLWTFDQNWEGKQYASHNWHGYAGVQGWWKRSRAGAAKVT